MPWVRVSSRDRRSKKKWGCGTVIFFLVAIWAIYHVLSSGIYLMDTTGQDTRSYKLQIGEPE